MDYSRFSALQLGKMIKNGELTSPELCEYYLSKEDSYNAFIYRNAEAVLEQAKKIQRKIESGKINSLLAGVPIAVKDNICIENTPATCGSKMLDGFVPPYSATVVNKLKSAGLVFLGKTNMDEFAMGSTGESSHFGETLNPTDLSRAAGGSSSGSAAAVSGGLAPLALGSDTGGSVRMPAAYCGIYGLKPTYGAVSRYGLIAYASSLDTIGTLCKTAGDTQALFSVICGRDGRDSTSIDYKDSKPFNSLKDVKIGFLPESSGEAIELFKSLGASTEAFELKLLPYCVAVYYILACAEASSNLARYDGIRYGHKSENADTLAELYVNSRTEAFGFETKKRIMLGNFVLSAGYYEQYYLKALKVKNMIFNEVKEAFSKYDFILAPVTDGCAPRLGESLENPLDMYNSDRFNVIANLTGLPSISIPTGDGGSVQLIGKPCSEQSLTGAAALLEKEINNEL